MISHSSQEIHLWPSGADGESSRAAGPLRLAPGPSTLSQDSARPTPPVLVEPLFNGQKQLRLLATFPADTNPTVNGQLALHRTVLAPGDRFSADGETSYAVTLFHRPQIGPPPVALIGRACPVCRVPVQASSRCVLCPCGAAIHCELAGPESLQCAELGPTCPICRRPIILSEGYPEKPDHEA